MALKDDLAADVHNSIYADWKARDGRVVPTTESVATSGGRVDLAAAMLYADLADSTKLAIAHPLPAAHLFKAYLASSARIIRAEGGEIRSFDGDRIMAVFVGGTPNTSAVRTGLKINWTFVNVVKPKFLTAYPGVFGQNAGHTLGHAVGIDSSPIHVVRAGIRDNSDLVWVGRAPNVAAKLSGIREAPYNVWITDSVYAAAHESARLTKGVNMWEERQWAAVPVPKIYRSTWTWQP